MDIHRLLNVYIKCYHNPLMHSIVSINCVSEHVFMCKMVVNIVWASCTNCISYL